MKNRNSFRLALVVILLTLNPLQLFADNWEQIQTTIAPQARTGHSLNYINGKVYLFGGDYVANRDILNDLWVYNEGETWETTPTTTSPTARKYHATTTKNGKLYVFGGNTATGYSNELFVFDPDTGVWGELSPSGELPAARAYATLSAGEDNKLYLAYGKENNGEEFTDLSDVWSYDIDANSWTQVADCGSSMVRYLHFAGVVGKALITGYGRGGATIRDDMVKVDLDTGECSTITVQGPVPKATKSPSYTSLGDWIMLSGGTHQTVVESKQRAISYSYSTSNEIWLFNTQTNQWTQGSDGLALSHGAAAYLGYNRFLFFGGSDSSGQRSNESWVYTADIDSSASCASTDGLLNVNVQCAALGSVQYQANLTHVTHPENANSHLWKLGSGEFVSGNITHCANLDSQYNLSFPCVNVGSSIYQVELPRYNHPDDPSGFYWSLGEAVILP